MDMKKIGCFLKTLRKEKGLTQEQLAEILGVAGRTVSRWENASNMPDLSILMEISEFFQVEIKELLDGERKSEEMNNEVKDTLAKIADYDKTKKEKIAKIISIAFIMTVLVGVLILLIELVVFKDIRFIIGETIILFIGGITAVIMTAYNGLWNNQQNGTNTVAKDLILSIIMSAIFTIALSFFVYRVSMDISKTGLISVIFFICISLLGFFVLRLMSIWSKKRENKN